MLVPNRHSSTDAYRYGFNGKEKDDELKGEGNSYDYGARMYDPRVGRWFTPDPLEKKYPNNSTYSSSLNSPLTILDYDGRDVIITITKIESGIAKIRVVSDAQLGSYVIETTAYQMTVKDDVTGQTSTYMITRDSPVAQVDPKGKFVGINKKEFRVDNVAFEPKDVVGKYQGVIRKDGKAGARIELRDPNNINDAGVESESGERFNIQVHVGGEYTPAGSNYRSVTGSVGCFTLCEAVDANGQVIKDDSDNNGRDAFIKDVEERIKINKEKGKGENIKVEIKKRNTNEKEDFNN